MQNLIDRPVVDPTDEDENAYLFTEEEKAAIFRGMDADPYGDGPLPKPEPPKAAAKPRKPYDPGTAKGLTKTAPGVYEVQSFRTAGKSYRVDLRNGTCSCPAHVKNPQKECKHQLQVWEAVARETFLQALSQPLAKLAGAIKRTTRPEVRNALLCALLRKQDRFQPEI